MRLPFNKVNSQKWSLLCRSWGLLTTALIGEVANNRNIYIFRTLLAIISCFGTPYVGWSSGFPGTIGIRNASIHQIFSNRYRRNQNFAQAWSLSMQRRPLTIKFKPVNKCFPELRNELCLASIARLDSDASRQIDFFRISAATDSR